MNIISNKTNIDCLRKFYKKSFVIKARKGEFSEASVTHKETYHKSNRKSVTEIVTGSWPILDRGFDKDYLKITLQFTRKINIETKEWTIGTFNIYLELHSGDHCEIISTKDKQKSLSWWSKSMTKLNIQGYYVCWLKKLMQENYPQYFHEFDPLDMSGWWKEISPTVGENEGDNL